MHNLIILSERNYSQICIQRSPLGQGKNDMFRQMTAYLILVDLNFLFRSAMIRYQKTFYWKMKKWWSLCNALVFL